MPEQQEQGPWQDFQPQQAAPQQGGPWEDFQPQQQLPVQLPPPATVPPAGTSAQQPPSPATPTTQPSPSPLEQFGSAIGGGLWSKKFGPEIPGTAKAWDIATGHRMPWEPPIGGGPSPLIKGMITGMGGQPPAAAPTRPSVAPAPAPAQQAQPSVAPTAKPEATNIWQAFPDDNQLADHLAHMENPTGSQTAITVRNNNPGALKAHGEIRKFASYEEGRQTLLQQISRWRDKNSDWSVADFNRNYAPDKSHGGDNPDGTEAGRNRYMMGIVTPSAGQAKTQAPSQARTMKRGSAPVGLLEPGNIDLDKRIAVSNPTPEDPDRISTVDSTSFNIEGKEVLLPSVFDGKLHDPKTEEGKRATIQHYRDTGEFLGKFDTPAHATAYSLALHDEQAEQYHPQAPTQAPVSAPPPGFVEEPKSGDWGEWIGNLLGKLSRSEVESVLRTIETAKEEAGGMVTPFLKASAPYVAWQMYKKATGQPNKLGEIPPNAIKALAPLLVGMVGEAGEAAAPAEAAETEAAKAPTAKAPAQAPTTATPAEPEATGEPVKGKLPQRFKSIQPGERTAVGTEGPTKGLRLEERGGKWYDTTTGEEYKWAVRRR